MTILDRSMSERSHWPKYLSMSKRNISMTSIGDIVGEGPPPRCNPTSVLYRSGVQDPSQLPWMNHDHEKQCRNPVRRCSTHNPASLSALKKSSIRRQEPHQPLPLTAKVSRLFVHVTMFDVVYWSTVGCCNKITKTLC